ncbi:MAG: type II secretion system inner membrane protein GspF [Gammaproteobacteria bacterium]|nr:type II secretion system inner membrane protein GspF [Gammaproteobacteria bacterium]
MTAYNYLALETTGRERRGTIEADTPRHARQLLREKELLPVDVDEIKSASTDTSLGTVKFSNQRMRAVDLTLFTRQIATLLRAGIPLDEALAAVAEQTDRRAVKSIIMGVRSKILEGFTLAQAFAEFPKAFPDIYLATVAAGEHAGQLDNVLERLADFTENRQILKSKIVNALIYPIILILACVSIIIVMMNFVVPKIVKIYIDGDFDLPPLTNAVIAISDFTTEYIWFILAGLLLLFIGFRIMLRQDDFKRGWHQFLLKIPLIGYLIRGLNTARFTRTMSIMGSSGVNILESLNLSGHVVNNLPMREAIDEVSVKVREGASVGHSLAQSKLFPPMTVHLIKSGEASGQLEDMLERAAINQERELENTISSLLAIMQPLMILIMAGIVVTIVLAIMLPIFNLNSFVS